VPCPGTQPFRRVVGRRIDEVRPWAEMVLSSPPGRLPINACEHSFVEPATPSTFGMMAPMPQPGDRYAQAFTVEPG
jgi:hypothetical protein